MAVKTGIAQQAFGTATDRRWINHYLLFLTIRAAVSPEQDGSPHKQAFDWAAGHKADQPEFMALTNHNSRDRRLVRINDQLLNEPETPTKITGGYGSPGPDGGHIRPLFLRPK